jgi:SAM-dependent methyltransferase
VDKDAGSLDRQRETFARRHPGARVHWLKADFTRPLELPHLDGLVMANSLHFQRDKRPVLHLVAAYLKPNGRFLLIEYDADRGNPWVPHPLSYRTWERVAAENGLSGTRLLHRVPSRHLDAIYSAVSYR